MNKQDENFLFCESDTNNMSPIQSSFLPYQDLNNIFEISQNNELKNQEEKGNKKINSAIPQVILSECQGLFSGIFNPLNTPITSHVEIIKDIIKLKLEDPFINDEILGEKISCCNNPEVTGFSDSLFSEAKLSPIQGNLENVVLKTINPLLIENSKECAKYDCSFKNIEVNDKNKGTRKDKSIEEMRKKNSESAKKSRKKRKIREQQTLNMKNEISNQIKALITRRNIALTKIAYLRDAIQQKKIEIYNKTGQTMNNDKI